MHMLEPYIRVLVLVALLVAGTLVLSAARVSASPLLDLVGDNAASGGLQARTVPGGAAAAYFNPALLTATPATVGVGFMILNERIGIHLDGRPGSEFAIPEGIANAGHADGTRFDNYPIPTNWLQFGRPADPRHDAFIARPRQAAGTGHDTLSYEVIGLLVKLFDDRLALGMHGLIPNGQFTRLRAFFNDEREQYFSNSLHPELYSDRMTAVSLALGAGVKLSRQWALGIGATLALKANVGAPTYVSDTGNLGRILIAVDAAVNIGVAPHVGLSFTPIERLRLTLTAHTPQRVELGTNFTFLLANGVEQSSGVTLVLDYTPWQVGLGASYEVLADTKQTLSIAGSVLYARWSDYIDRHGERPTSAYAWADTIAPVLGARYRIGDLAALVDVTYVPTPVPAQTGRSNYADNDRVATSLGADYRFQLLGSDIKFGVALQAHRLLPRHQTKLPTPTRQDGANLAPQRVKDELPDDAQLGGDPLANAAGLQTNNPGWPGFESAGWVLGATAYLSLSLE